MYNANTINFLFELGAFISCGILCSFFVVLSTIKQEFWVVVKGNIE